MTRTELGLLQNKLQFQGRQGLPNLFRLMADDQTNSGWL
jgi:hypothetical protein